MYVYIKSEPGLWTVGFYSPNGDWHPDRDFNDKETAAERVHWLNGGEIPQHIGIDADLQPIDLEWNKNKQEGI